MLRRTFLLCALTVTSLTLAGASQAAGQRSDPAPLAAPAFFAADLKGANEVPPADPDGSGFAIVRIADNQICFTTAWAAIAAPTAGHIHVGAAGVNGPIRVGFFGTAIPVGLHTITGCLNADPAVLAGIVANPAGHYVNLHNAQFPGGAIRGQLRALTSGVDLLAPFRSGHLVGLLDGAQETPAAGDPDGHGVGFVQAEGTTVRFGLSWNGIAPPTLGHIHVGPIGVAGPIVVSFFTAPGGLPPSVTGVAGAATATADVTAAINLAPANYYINMHNSPFPAGALRGQLFRAGT